jgi:hypothetical protein
MELSRYFSKEEIEMSDIYVKKCSTFLGFREMKIRIT